MSTDVTFKQLNDKEIDYYVDNYHPLDKAGAYGIQEWIGYVGVTVARKLFQRHGTPAQRIWDELNAFVNQ